MANHGVRQGNMCAGAVSCDMTCRYTRTMDEEHAVVDNTKCSNTSVQFLQAVVQHAGTAQPRIKKVLLWLIMV